MKNKLWTLLIGIYFGIVLIKSQVISWFRINDMFQFKEPYMYLVICSAIAVGLVSVFLIRRLETRTIEGDVIVIKERPFHPGNVIGGASHGMIMDTGNYIALSGPEGSSINDYRAIQSRNASTSFVEWECGHGKVVNTGDVTFHSIDPDTNVVTTTIIDESIRTSRGVQPLTS